MRAVRRLFVGVASVTALALATFAGILVAIRILGFTAAVVTGGSMAPTIPVGALILIEPVGPASIAVGDVITFALPDRLITHRVVAIAHDDAGLELVTKGDANDAADPVAIRAGSAIGAVRLSVPLAGYALAELQGWWRAIAAVILAGIALDAARRRLERSRLTPAAA